MATSAARAGATEADIMRQTGHKCLPVLRRYIRRRSLFTDNAAGKLGPWPQSAARPWTARSRSSHHLPIRRHPRGAAAGERGGKGRKWNGSGDTEAGSAGRMPQPAPDAAEATRGGRDERDVRSRRESGKRCRITSCERGLWLPGRRALQLRRLAGLDELAIMPAGRRRGRGLAAGAGIDLPSAVPGMSTATLGPRLARLLGARPRESLRRL